MTTDSGAPADPVEAGSRDGYCSWCGELSTHALLQERWIRRAVYQCMTCHWYTIPCRHCDNMARAATHQTNQPPARGSHYKRPRPRGWIGRARSELDTHFIENWDNRLCAEHNGDIPDFTKAKMQIGELDEFLGLLKPRQVNLLRTTVVTGSVASLGVSGWFMTLAAFPGIASSLGAFGMLGAAGTGTAISTLSGAALMSASVAWLGAGGLGVLCAIGAGAGGNAGYAIACIYTKDVRGFEFINKTTDGQDASQRLVFISVKRLRSILR